MTTLLSLETARTLLTPPPPVPVVYSLADVEQVFGVIYSLEQREALAGVPFSEETLRACVGTHMLFPSFPISLLDIRERHAALFRTRTGGWYAEARETFSCETVPIRWHLLRIEPVKASRSKTWSEQKALLLADEDVPSATTVAFAMMLHHKVTGMRLFERLYVRTSDVVADGNRVTVGFFNAVGLDVSGGWDDSRDDYLGMSSARKY